jgi:3-deoxy-D-manno-octulosonate 8-phosphate phosphatase (KDO 8-P phosphatase)
MMHASRTVINRAKKIKLLILDVDGVLTDGRIIYDSQGRELKFFDVRDGMGVHLLNLAGIKTVLLTAKGSRSIHPRARDMQVEALYEDAVPKFKIYAQLLKRFRLKDEEVCVMGDDLVDLAPMSKAGLAISVPGACAPIQEVSHYCTKRVGGRGAVRETAELILKAQGQWKRLVDIYRK